MDERRKTETHFNFLIIFVVVLCRLSLQFVYMLFYKNNYDDDEMLINNNNSYNNNNKLKKFFTK